MNLKSGIFQADKEQNRIHYESHDAVQHLSSSINQHLPRLLVRPIVIVCIGTDRSTGDCLGPLVGTNLKSQLSHFHIYGTLEEPVHAVNLEETLTLIQERYRYPFIIAVDACLGRMKSVGYLQVGHGPIKPGAGVNKVLPDVGDIHITGVVNVSGFMEFFVLQNTRLHLVMGMANSISQAIIEAEQTYLEKRRTLKEKWLIRVDALN
ncbi:spore protease YyaC [Metabacillus herbersteinensis]|uniref:Spore protease YyaC n=1 Tax=Metabacillus herbersteinensis TaxID=283816 RepID=A0ABV6GHB2_9BACI